jgi:2-oxoglutarate dehydrogenase E1 component
VTQKFNYLKSENADYIEELFQKYSSDPDSVDESWRYFFEGMEIALPSAGQEVPGGNGHAAEPGAAPSPALQAVPTAPAYVEPAPGTQLANAEAKVGEFIQTYRELGLRLADINPLEAPAKSHPALELSAFGLSESDLDRRFSAARLLGLPAGATLRDILSFLRETYCGTVGVEYTHIQDPNVRDWLEERMETTHNRAALNREQKLRVLSKLTEAECFERFLHTRYVGQKRFSVEGGDNLIPMLDAIIDESAELGAVDFVLGMAHRGRLSVLTSIFAKKYEFLFKEFDGVYATDGNGGEGDVKYHMGYSADFQTPRGKKIHLSLANNPSHLEFVNPVVEGATRAKLGVRAKAANKSLEEVFQTVVPVLIHGDAAFAGQGVCYETIQLSQLRGYATGGTIHIVVNNQVGFTTNPAEARSTTYSTDLAMMIQSPIFHVNGDDAEACDYVVRLATQFRQKYHRDVVIDLICYRKYGHNEGDEPSFTQPLMYKKIKEHPSPREVYASRLAAEGSIPESESTALVTAMNEKLTAAHAVAKSSKEPPVVSVFEGAWKGLRRATPEDFNATPKTSVAADVLRKIGAALSQAPAGFTIHPKLERVLKLRSQAIEVGTGIDWGGGEALAFGSLALEGTHVRLSGQDAERGTFSHRHSVLYDFETGARYVPLNGLKPGQAEYFVVNSPLSECAVMGFEYGFAIAEPRALTIWEAQFGDFTNGAQVIVDQFLASSESKWQRMCGLTLLLPHGYEGQGPEHSSARLERFLQLCAKQNMQVCNLTTPAQLFHALRRQVVREFRKPLIIVSPKSLLRHPAAVSKLEDFSQAQFQEVIDDPNPPTKARKLVFCTGKVYYDLVAERDAKKVTDVAIVRIEQLYPWPHQRVEPILKKYQGAEVLWVQEEPRNMGAWNYLRDFLPDMLGGDRKLTYVGRSPAAAPAVGSSKVHEKEQHTIVEEALK